MYMCMSAIIAHLWSRQDSSVGCEAASYIGLREQLRLGLFGVGWCGRERGSERGMLRGGGRARFRARGSIVGIAVL